jgi:hypothetical protein
VRPPGRTRYEPGADPRPPSGNRGVTFTDPFGLRTCPPHCTNIHAVGTAIGAAVGAVAGGVGGAAAGTAVLPVAGTLGGGAAGATAGAAEGAVVGLAVANVADAVAEATGAAMSSVGRVVRKGVGVIFGAWVTATTPGGPKSDDSQNGVNGRRAPAAAEPTAEPAPGNGAERPKEENNP